MARSVSERRLHWVRSRMRREAQSCVSKNGMKVCALRDTPPTRSSRRTGKVLVWVKPSVDIRRVRAPFFREEGVKKSPFILTQPVKSSSRMYFAFWISSWSGKSVTCSQPLNLTYVNVVSWKFVLFVSCDNSVQQP